MDTRLICTKTIDNAIDRMMGMVERMARYPECLSFIMMLSATLRMATKMHRHNAMIKKKLYLLSYQAGRDHVIRYLGGEKKLSAWERRKASEAARIAATHRKRPPQWWLDKHHARLKAEAERTQHFARPDNCGSGIYKGTPDYALEVIKRGPSILRGCSLARRPARPPHGLDFLPTIYFVPSELRPRPSQTLPHARVKLRARKSARAAPPRRPVSPAATAPQWEHISTEQAIAEIFGGQARASP